MWYSLCANTMLPKGLQHPQILASVGGILELIPPCMRWVTVHLREAATKTKNPDIFFLPEFVVES